MHFQAVLALLTLASISSALNVPQVKILPRTPLAPKQFGNVAYKRNQYNPRNSATKTFRIKRAYGSPDCSAQNLCKGDNQYCSGAGNCESCPAHSVTMGTSCACNTGYDKRSTDGKDYCQCSNTVSGTSGPSAGCETATCLSGYSKQTSSKNELICACTYGSFDESGRCTTCASGYSSTSRNGVNTCVCANGVDDNGACKSCNAGYKLMNGTCKKTCTSGATCSGATPFCSPASSTCVSTCSTDSQCGTGQVCSLGTCQASTRCSRRGTLCANGGTCTLQSYCATNQSPADGAYVGCFRETSYRYRGFGTNTLGVDYLSRNDNVSIDSCTSFCKSKNYKYAAVKYISGSYSSSAYNECYCANVNGGATATETSCSLSCNAAQAQLCGGDSYYSAYSINA